MKDALTRRVIADTRTMLQMIDSVGGNEVQPSLKRFWGALETALKELEAATTRQSADEPERACEGFKWIGQPLNSCDGCARPAWEHEGLWESLGGPFDARSAIREWNPEEPMGRAHAAWKAGHPVDSKIDDETGQIHLRYPDS